MESCLRYLHFLLKVQVKQTEIVKIGTRFIWYGEIAEIRSLRQKDHTRKPQYFCGDSDSSKNQHFWVLQRNQTKQKQPTTSTQFDGNIQHDTRNLCGRRYRSQKWDRRTTEKCTKQKWAKVKVQKSKLLPRDKRGFWEVLWHCCRRTQRWTNWKSKEIGNERERKTGKEREEKVVKNSERTIKEKKSTVNIQQYGNENSGKVHFDDWSKRKLFQASSCYQEE